MLNKLIVISLFYLPLSAFSAEFEFSLGAGFQYSGVIGTQFAIKHEDSKYFLSVGLPGYSLGMQTIVADNEYHSVGFSLGEIQDIFGGDHQYGFLTYNYHMDGFKNKGWVFGTGVGFYHEESSTSLFSHEHINGATTAMYTLDVGYKF